MTTTRHANDCYLTPAKVVATVKPFLGFLGMVLDPAAGEGVFQDVLGEGARNWTNVDIRSDAGARGLIARNFLTMMPWQARELIIYDTIITNPPFNLAEAFIRHALEVWQPRRLVLLMRLSMLEGAGRQALWQEHPPRQVVVLPRRPVFSGFNVADRWAYAWFLWGDVAGSGIAWTKEGI